MVTIVIADDHDIIREGIKSIISSRPEYKVLAEASDGEDVLDKVKRLKPDILLLDISMPKVSGLDVIGRIKYISPQTRVVVISMHKSNIYITKALKSGARGYLLKENVVDDLLPALSKISIGGVYICSEVSEFLIEKSLEKDSEVIDNNFGFTQREADILRLVAEGKTAKEIANVLFISPRTVENYKNNMLRKFNLRRTSDLVKYAIKHRIVDIDG